MGDKRDIRIGKSPKKPRDQVETSRTEEILQSYFQDDPVAGIEARRRYEYEQIRSIRSPTGRNPSAVIFGAGVAGLSAAHELIERGFMVQVVEPARSPDEEYACEVGGMARNQFVRTRETQRIHPYLYYGHNSNPYSNVDFPETQEWDRPPEGYMAGPLPWDPIYERDPDPRDHNLIRRHVSAIRKLVNRRAASRTGVPERIYFPHNDPLYEPFYADFHGVRNWIKIDRLVSRILAAYASFYRELVVDLRQTPFSLPDLHPEMCLREILLIEVRGHCAEADDPIDGRVLSWRRANAVKLALVQRAEIALRTAMTSDAYDKARSALEKAGYQYDQLEPEQIVLLHYNELHYLRDGVTGGKQPADDVDNPHLYLANHLVVRAMAACEGVGDRKIRDDRRRSDRVELHIVEHELPGEHGYRFFPSFYRHLFDIMNRTPILDADGTETIETAYDMLKTPPAVAVGLDDGKHFHESAREKMASLEELRQSLEFVFKKLGVTPRDSLRMVVQLLKFLTSSPDRRVKYEEMSWLQFIDGESELEPRGWDEVIDDRTGYSKRAEHLIRELPQALIAMGAEETDAATYGVVSSQLFVDYGGDGDQTDMTLRGPTSHSWLRPWKRYLEEQGVQFFVGRLECLEEREGHELFPVVTGITDEKGPTPEDYRNKLLNACGPKDEVPCVLQGVGHGRQVAKVLISARQRIAVDQRVVSFEFPPAAFAPASGTIASIAVSEDEVVSNGDQMLTLQDGRTFEFQGIGSNRIVKKITKVLGEPVDRGDEILQFFDYGETMLSPITGTVERFIARVGDVVSDYDPLLIIRTRRGLESVALRNIGSNRTVSVIHKNAGDPIRDGDRLVDFLSKSEVQAKDNYSEVLWIVAADTRVSDGDVMAELLDANGTPVTLRFEDIGQRRLVSDVKVEVRDFVAKDDLMVRMDRYGSYGYASCQGTITRIGVEVGDLVSEQDPFGYVAEQELCPPPDFYVMALPYEQATEVLWKSYRNSVCHRDLQPIDEKIRNYLKTGTGRPLDDFAEEVAAELAEHLLRNLPRMREFLRRYENSDPEAQNRLEKLRKRVLKMRIVDKKIQKYVANGDGNARRIARLTVRWLNYTGRADKTGIDSYIARISGEVPDGTKLERDRLDELIRAIGAISLPEPPPLDAYETCKDLFKPGIQYEGDLLGLQRFDVWTAARHDEFGVPQDREWGDPPFVTQRDLDGRPRDRFRYPLRDFFGTQFYFTGQVRLGDGHLTFPDAKWGLSSISQIFHWRSRPSRKQGFLGQLSIDVGDVYEKDERIGKTAWQSSADEIAETVWRQIKASTEETYRRYVSDPTCYHIDQNIRFEDPDILLGVPADCPPELELCRIRWNESPYFICMPTQWKERPGVVRNVLRPEDFDHGEWFWSDVGRREIFYRPSHHRWFLAGSYMPTTTRLTTMESACESARHAVNGMLHTLLTDCDDRYVGSGMLVAEVARIFDPERFEFRALDPLKRLDRELMAEGLPHFLDILGVLDYVDSMSASDDPKDNPLGNLIRLIQQTGSTTFSDWEPLFKSLLGTYTGNADKLFEVLRRLYRDGRTILDTSTRRTDT